MDTAASSCKLILKRDFKYNFENIYIVTWGNPFNLDPSCETFNFNNCSSQKFIELIKNQKYNLGQG